jgi:hypothetical protein
LIIIDQQVFNYEKCSNQSLLTVLFRLFSYSLTEAATVAKDADFNFYIDDAFHFSARVQAGYLTGTANELVYAGSYSETLTAN